MLLKKRIAVLGGGTSGLASIKPCLDEGFEVTCYEVQKDLGGLWRFRDDEEDGVASVMNSTIINSSKEMNAYSDFPPPTDMPNYCHNSMMIKYFELYADKFDLTKHILFRHKVIQVTQAKDYDTHGQWTVKVRDLETNNEFEEVFDGVMVCTGHHAFPYQPTFEGMDTFQGKVIHTHSYKKPAGYEGKKVVIVGVGNSGGDVAVELSTTAQKVYLSTRRGCWVIHRVGPNGLPYDAHFLQRYYMAISNCLPFWLLNTWSERAMNKRFDHALYNLKPKHRLFSQHPMVNDTLPNRIVSGTVVVKNDIQRFTTRGVVFVGEEEKEYECDTVFMATGYLCKFPFLREEIFNPEDNRCDLYKHVFPPNLKHPSLAFIALVQPVGSLFPIAENQARWFAQLMAKNAKLPPKGDMIKDIRKKTEAISKKYYAGARHTIQVDWIPYMDEIASQYGAKPNLAYFLLKDPKLFLRCLFGPCLPYQYRLQGPRTWDGARDAIFNYEKRVRGAFNTRVRQKERGQSLIAWYYVVGVASFAVSVMFLLFGV